MKFSASYLKMIRLGPDQQRLYVVEAAEKQVVAYDVSKPWECSIYFVNERPEDITFSADGSKLYLWCPSKLIIYVLGF